MKYDADDIAYIRQFTPKSLFIFFQEFWHVIEPTKEPVYNWHIEKLCGILQAHAERVAAKLPRDKHLVINVPPGTTKSTLVSVMFPAWAWINWPWMKFITGSYEETLALRDAVKSRDIIKSDLYQACFRNVFKLKMDVNKKSEYANDKGGFRVATSVSGSITGYHADIWVIDDPIDPRGAKSRAEIQSTKEWMDLTIPSRMTDLNISVQIMIMQRLADDDPTGHVLARPGDHWEYICLPAEVGNNVRPVEFAAHYKDGLLDPVRLSRNVLDEMRTTLGSKGYAGQYLQRPAPEEGNLFKKVWFERFNMFDLRNESLKHFEEIVWHFRGDTAYTEKSANDPSGFLCYCYIGADMYIRDYATVRKEMPELIIFCKDFAFRNEYMDKSTFKVEPKASGQSLIQMLKSSTGLNISKAETPKGDKIYRANTVVPMVEAGRVHLLDSAPWLDTFLHEVCTFPDAEHDEAVDLLSMALKEKLKSESGSILMRSV
jgi:predicted phage terminase large subunit-like protein